jgi:hypothetical protein
MSGRREGMLDNGQPIPCTKERWEVNDDAGTELAARLRRRTVVFEVSDLVVAKRKRRCKCNENITRNKPTPKGNAITRKQNKE